MSIKYVSGTNPYIRISQNKEINVKSAGQVRSGQVSVPMMKPFSFLVEKEFPAASLI